MVWNVWKRNIFGFCERGFGGFRGWAGIVRKAFIINSLWVLFAELRSYYECAIYRGCRDLPEHDGAGGFYIRRVLYMESRQSFRLLDGRAAIGRNPNWFCCASFSRWAQSQPERDPTLPRTPFGDRSSKCADAGPAVHSWKADLTWTLPPVSTE